MARNKWIYGLEEADKAYASLCMDIFIDRVVDIDRNFTSSFKYYFNSNSFSFLNINNFLYFKLLSFLKLRVLSVSKIISKFKYTFKLIFPILLIIEGVKNKFV